MRRAARFLLLLAAVSARAATTNNDDSCDIALQPAATLLLPYFEVDLKAPATTTLVTIQNVSPASVIANVTLWTDWGYPALNFPIHLTGYDVQGINLYDVLGRGALPPTDCHAGNISPAILPDLQAALTIGGTGACTGAIGFFHFRAVGYLTIDVVASCAATNATSRDYFANLRFDNVLTGDYQQLSTRDGRAFASGGPLVHIRAIPEGGAAGAVVANALPHTFYERYMPDPVPANADRRQPLPSVFVPRTAFATTLKIWREAAAVGTCVGARLNSSMPLADVVRFDEHENATIASAPPGTPIAIALPANTTLLPGFSTTGDLAGRRRRLLRGERRARRGRAEVWSRAAAHSLEGHRAPERYAECFRRDPAAPKRNASRLRRPLRRDRAPARRQRVSVRFSQPQRGRDSATVVRVSTRSHDQGRVRQRLPRNAAFLSRRRRIRVLAFVTLWRGREC